MTNEFHLPFMELPFVLGLILLIVNVIFYFFPPKKINYLYGYRTSNSMRNQETWNFAQRYAAIRGLQGSVFLLAVSSLSAFFDIRPDVQIAIGVISILLFLIWIMYTTEKTIKTKFPKT